MRGGWLLAALLAVGIASGAWANRVRAGGDDDVAPVKTTTLQRRYALDECVERAYHWARNQEDAPDNPDFDRVTIVSQVDDGGRKGVLALVEFSDGSLGLYLAARQDPARDNRVVIDKKNLLKVVESINRCRGGNWGQ